MSVDVAVSNGENLVVIEKVARENKIDLKNYRFLRQSLPEGNVLLRSAMMTQMMIIIIIKIIKIMIIIIIIRQITTTTIIIVIVIIITIIVIIVQNVSYMLKYNCRPRLVG